MSELRKKPPLLQAFELNSLHALSSTQIPSERNYLALVSQGTISEKKQAPVMVGGACLQFPSLSETPGGTGDGVALSQKLTQERKPTQSK